MPENVSSDRGKSSSSSSVADMFDRMKSLDYFRIASNNPSPLQSAHTTTATSSSSSSKESCWITPKSLGILEGMSLFSEDSSSGNTTDGTSPGSASIETSTPGGGSKRILTTGSLYNNIRQGADRLDLTKYVNAQAKNLSFSHRIEQLFTEYMMAVAVGAVAGAAVATGVAVGLLAMSGFTRLANDYIPSLYHWAFPALARKYYHDDDNDNKNDSSSSSNNSGRETKTNITLIPTDQLVLIQGKVKDVYQSSFDQCKQTLDAVSVTLSKQQSLGWQNVKRITAYLANNKCDAKTFRHALSEFPIDQQNCIVTIMYVARLEDARSVVEIEITAATNPPEVVARRR